MQSKQYFTKIKNYPHEKSTEPLFSQKGAIFVIILRAACRSCRIVEEDIRRGATEDGMKKTRTETVCKMKSDGIPFSTMAQYTELSIEEIEQL